MSTKLLAVLFMTAAAWAATHTTAAEGFAALQSAAKSNDAAKLETLLPSAAIKDRPGFDAALEKEWRETFAKEIAAAKVAAIREKEDDAVVRFTLPPATEDRELVLHFADGTWHIVGARSYLVKGKSLDDARGARPQKITLKMRTKADAFESSGFSFTHVTGVAKDCKNRMDVWYCQNGDLHAGNESKIASLGALDLAKVDGIPIGVAWSDLVPTNVGKVGDTCAVHCTGEDRREFFVKLRITEKKADSIGIEWTLLTDGLHSPKTIAKPQPLQSNDGEDGLPAMCGKRGG